MATRTQIKAYFQAGDTPTQAQFEEFFDSIPFFEDTTPTTLVGGVLNVGDDNGNWYVQTYTGAGLLQSGIGFYTDTSNLDVFVYNDGNAGVENISYVRASDELRIESYAGAGGINLVAGGKIVITNANDYADDAAAAIGGVPVNGVYHTSGVLKIRLT